MTSVAMKLRLSNKGITITFYTIVIALISIGVLALILVLFIQKNYDIRLTIQETEQDRSVVNLVQALISSDKLVYVDGNGVVHRGVLDAAKVDKIKDAAYMQEIKNDLTYPDFDYKIAVKDLDRNTVTESTSSAFVNYDSNKQTRQFPVAIRYASQTIDAGVISVSAGFIKASK